MNLSEFYLLNVGGGSSGGGGGAILPLSYDRRVFTEGGTPWIYKGVSFFKIGELARTGQWALIDGILDDFDGFNVARAFDYVTWIGTGWESPGANVWLETVEHLRARGWRLELCLLTDDDAARLGPAKTLVGQLSASPLSNLRESVLHEC